MVRFVVHLADIHIRTLRMHDEYKDVFKTLLKDLRELLVDYSREEIRIVIAGDLVHQKIVISNEMLILGTWFLRKLEEIAPVIIIAGNHDLLENNSNRMDSISPMVQFLGDKEINYFKESKCYLDDNIVWCVYSIFEENNRPNIEEFKKLIGNDKKYIGLYHAPVTGAITSIGFEFEESVELSQFDGCDAVLMGDIHHRQNFIYKGINIAYCGSLIQQDFGERVDNHGYLIWDVNDLTYTEHNIKNNYGYYVFKINSLDDIEEEREYISNY